MQNNMDTKKLKGNAELGQRIVAARERLGLEQQQLAKLIGSPASSLSNWERGVYDLPTGKLLQIAEALGVSPSSLLEPDKDMLQKDYLKVNEVERSLIITLRRFGKDGNIIATLLLKIFELLMHKQVIFSRESVDREA